jgi:hypothetical protein
MTDDPWELLAKAMGKTPTASDIQVRLIMAGIASPELRRVFQWMTQGPEELRIDRVSAELGQIVQPFLKVSYAMGAAKVDGTMITLNLEDLSFLMALSYGLGTRRASTAGLFKEGGDG